MTLIIRKPSGRPIGKTRCEGGKKRSQRGKERREVAMSSNTGERQERRSVITENRGGRREGGTKAG